MLNTGEKHILYRLTALYLRIPVFSFELDYAICELIEARYIDGGTNSDQEVSIISG